jgi:hypothetical protein
MANRSSGRNLEGRGLRGCSRSRAPGVPVGWEQLTGRPRPGFPGGDSGPRPAAKLIRPRPQRAGSVGAGGRNP